MIPFFKMSAIKRKEEERPSISTRSRNGLRLSEPPPYTMEKLGDLHLNVGQLAEMKSFDRGFRGAWFRCKIRDVMLKKDKVLLEYYDFPDEEITPAKLYEVPHYGRKSKQINKQLMMRPHYPLMSRKSEMPPVNSISEVCVIIDGSWKVGDLVDWLKDNCYWSARVIKVLSDDKVQIELPMIPAGEGGTHEAFCKDLRPSLDWSAGKGWALATMDGQSSSSAQLIFPSQQDEVTCMDSEVENAAEAADGEASSISEAAVEGDRMISEEVEMDGKGVTSTIYSSEDSISTLHVEGRKEDDAVMGNSDVKLNMMHEETLEAAIMDLEELAKGDRMISEEVKMDGKGGTSTIYSSEDSISILHVEGSKEDDAVMGSSSSDVKLNMMHEETLEAAIMDPEELAKGDGMISEEVKMDGKGVTSTIYSSEDSISTLHVEGSKEDDVVMGGSSSSSSSDVKLNMMYEDTLEAVIMDLEELANRAIWIKSILETNQDTTSSPSSSNWKFAD